MTDQLPAPLVPVDTDLQDFRFMPLDVVRLRDSRLAAQVSGEAFRCAVLLWCVSWHQVPAGSLPDDDVVLAGYAGFGRSVKEWKKHRADALHGWVTCADGRLYHPVVCEKVLEAREQKLRHWFRTECSRIKKSCERANIRPTYPTYEQWLDNYTSTGSRNWKLDETSSCNNLSPATGQGRAQDVRAESARTEQTGTEQTGTDRIAFKSSNPNTYASTQISERAEQLARAFSRGGFQVEGDSDLIRRYEAQGITVGEVEEAVTAAAGWLRRKPLAWVTARIENRHAESAAGAKPGRPPVLPVDPAIAARQAADRKLEDALIDARQLAETGIIKPEERAKREETARAAHAAAVAALGVTA